MKLSFTRRAHGNHWLHAHSIVGSEPTTYGNPIAHERIVRPSRKFMFVSESDTGEKVESLRTPKQNLFRQRQTFPAIVLSSPQRELPVAAAIANKEHRALQDRGLFALQGIFRFLRDRRNIARVSTASFTQSTLSARRLGSTPHVLRRTTGSEFS